jgi:hypothetical protein
MGLPRPPGSPIALSATGCWHSLPVATASRRCADPGGAVRTHPFAPDAHQRPGETLVRTALSPRYLTRMRPLVQVLAGPPAIPPAQSVAVLKPSALSVSVVHTWSTSRPTRHRRPPRESGPNGPATPGPLPGTNGRSGQGEAHRGVPGAGGDLFGTGPGGNPQGDRRMPQVVDAKPLQASGPGRRTPHPGAEARGAERGTVGEGEHEAIRLDRPAHKVFL